MRRLLGFSCAIMGFTTLILIGQFAYLRQLPSTAQVIVFASRWKDFPVFDIHRLNGDGTNREVLVTHVDPDSLALSPDGRWILYVSYDTGSNALYRMRVNGTDTQLVASVGTIIEKPVWSSDGEWILFLVTADPNEEEEGLYLVRFDGSQRHRLTDVGLINLSLTPYRPIWSPDGKWIAYEKMVANVDVLVRELYRIGSDGMNEKVLLRDEISNIPIWSLDSEWMFVSILRNDDSGNRQSGIYRMRPDGTNLELLTADFDFTGNQQLSPDGQWIVFSGQRDGQSDIFRMRTDGTEIQQLTNDTDVELNRRLASDGWITFVVFQDSFQTLTRMRLDGSDREAVFSLETNANLQWSPLIDMDWNLGQLGMISIGLGVASITMLIWKKAKHV